LSARFCVFCGQRPESKTREHVIPTWLIELTGDPKRKVRIGLNLTSGPPFKKREFAFDSFAFPACEECNASFSDLESLAKGVVTLMLERQPLTSADLTIFVDWLDKVRVGLWLGGIMLNKNCQGVRPSFHIQQRIGSADRLVAVYETDDEWEGLTWGGTDSPVFHFMPSCFSLTINRFCFVSVSSDFLFAQRIGFPYPEARYFDETGKHRVSLAPGTEAVSWPLFDYDFGAGCRQVWQPAVPWRQVMPGGPDSDPLGVYDSDYVRDMCLDYEAGVGKVFTWTSNGLEVLGSLASTCWLPPFTLSREEVAWRSAVAVFDILGQLYRAQPSLKLLPQPERLRVQNVADMTLKAHATLTNNILAQKDLWF
jgi:hypothetical protein